MFNNSDKFDHLIALAAINCAEEEAEALRNMDTSGVSFHESYYKKRAKIIKKYKRYPSGRSYKSTVVKVAVAAAVAVIMLSLFISCMPMLREAIYNAIVGWYEDYFTISYESPTGQERETEPVPENGEQIAVPTYIVEVHKPTDLPENILEDVVLKNSSKFAIDYYIGEEYLFSYSQFVLQPFDKYVDNEEIEVTSTYVNGNDATIVEYINKKEINIFWSDGEYAYHMFSTQCDVETLIKYAESVK